MLIVIEYTSEHDIKSFSDSFAHLFIGNLDTCLLILIYLVKTLFEFLLHVFENDIGRLFILYTLGDYLLEFVHNDLLVAVPSANVLRWRHLVFYA